MKTDQLMKPHELWKKIEDDYSNKSTTIQNELRRTLGMYKWKSSSPSAEYNRFIRIYHEYEAAGGTMDERTKIQYYLTCTPRAYDNIVDKIQMDKSMSLAEAQQELEAKARRMKAQAELNSIGKTKSVPAERNPRRPKQEEESALYCTICKRQNHKTQEHKYRNPRKQAEHNKKYGQKKQETANMAVEHEEIALITDDNLETALNMDVDDPRTWILDSGASKHMTSYRNNIEDYEEVKDRFVMTANGQKLSIIGKGKVKLHTKGHAKQSLVMHNVLHVPDLHKNLFSVKQCTEPGNNTVEFEKNKATIKHDKRPILTAQRNGKLYVIENSIHTSNTEDALCTASQ